MKKYIKSDTNLDTVNELYDFLADMFDSIDDLMGYVFTISGLPNEIDGLDISELYKLNDKLYDAADKVANKIIDIHQKISNW